MRTLLLGTAAAAGIVLTAITPGIAAPIASLQLRGPAAQSPLLLVHETRQCRRLRLACEKKDAASEAACQRHRRECVHKH